MVFNGACYRHNDEVPVEGTAGFVWMPKLKLRRQSIRLRGRSGNCSARFAMSSLSKLVDCLRAGGIETALSLAAEHHGVH